MASIVEEALIAAPAARVWAALRDVGALHTRLAPGFVTDAEREPGARTVTFANGLVVRELIIACDDARRRVAWSAVGGPLSLHNASAQVFEAGACACRVVWTAELASDAMVGPIEAMIREGMAAIKSAMEARAQAKPLKF